MKLGAAPEIRDMANALGLPPTGDAASAIIGYCAAKIDRWVVETGGVASLSEVQEVVCKKLHLVFEEIWSDEQLDVVIKKYLALGESGFASLRFQLNDDTFATLMERQHVTRRAHDRYVAVIDCRGGKAARRFFTRWHEIAHLLTLVKQLELPFHRSTNEQTPIERLMDSIAGEVGFYGPVFIPALAAELSGGRLLRFDVIERIRARCCPDASFLATLIACVKRAPMPLVQLEVGMGYKKCEQAAIGSPQLTMFASPKPVPKLRARRASPNPAARNCGFTVHPNMQVPDGSIIATHFNETLDTETSPGVSGTENFAIWRHSNGEPLGHGKIRVEVRKLAGTVLALIQPSAGARREPSDPSSV